MNIYLKRTLLVIATVVILFFSGVGFLKAFFWYFDNNGQSLITPVEGKSMEPTYHDGQNVYVNFLKKTPTVGDVIVFTCFSQCTSDESSKTLIKRVTQINESGQYWVEGDNKERSFDSRNYGWLSSSDIDIYGVVIK